jgi:glucose-6-phosphate 1-dehydrogenase
MAPADQASVNGMASALAARTAGPQIVEPHLFVVMGATGDLMKRKILPALFRLAEHGKLGDRFVVLGAARPADVDDHTFRSTACEVLQAARLENSSSRRWCQSRLYYQPLPDDTPEMYRDLTARIRALEESHGLPGNRVFYLALPPVAFPTTIAMLGQSGLDRSPGWTRLVIEKPFGRDLASAQELNRTVHRSFDESQVYRIDHYLGKETIQNLLTFRFANSIFETLWNRDRIKSVAITVAESLGVEHRAAYYESAGALRDMIQNHLTQLLTVTAMEFPAAFDARAIRYEKVKVLQSIRPISPEQVVLGQYTHGSIGGVEVPGYREEPGVKSDSDTETFVRLRLQIANWRWHGVPFYLSTGKRLAQRVSRIDITFRRPPGTIFKPLQTGVIHPNVLVITLQPNEGFDLQFEVKAPGQLIRLVPQNLHFRYAEAFAALPAAYETLLLDVMLGDQTLFVSADWAEASWRLYAPLLDQRLPVHPYRAGTWGPAAASGPLWPPKISEHRKAGRPHQSGSQAEEN